MSQNQKILVFGANGMLGSAIYNYIAFDREFEVLGTYRSGRITEGLIQHRKARLVQCSFDPGALYAIDLIKKIKPTTVINCIGVIKQLPQASEVLTAVPINTVLPHQLNATCQSVGARFIHFSTDCVFSGHTGNYKETVQPDAVDLYGLSKYLGEVNAKGSLTLRTSIIGHELRSKNSLLEWFLSQDKQVMGFTNAYFSGLPTNEVARVVLKIIKSYPHLFGLYHLAAEKISKHDLLTKINKIYRKNLDILPDGKLQIDRSLNADRLSSKISYKPRSWDELILEMQSFKDECNR
jgi:dTDP-4-dehydrorhamnose reductase